MEAIPLLNSLTDYRNFYSVLFYTSLCAIICKTLSRLATDRSLSASSNSCYCSPISAKTKSKVSKWNNNNNNVSLHSSSSGSESEAESEVMDNRPATNEPLLMAIILLIFPWLPASNLFFYVGFVVAGLCSFFPAETHENRLKGRSVCSAKTTLFYLIFFPQNVFCTFLPWASVFLLRPEWKL